MSVTSISVCVCISSHCYKKWFVIKCVGRIVVGAVSGRDASDKWAEWVEISWSSHEGSRECVCTAPRPFTPSALLLQHSGFCQWCFMI